MLTEVFTFSIGLIKMNTTIERCELASGLNISRILTGLWQIGDMEKDDNHLDYNAKAASMSPYIEAGFTTFDMADHYGSAEDIVGLFRRQQNSEKTVQLLTKWVPKPGITTREDVQVAVKRSMERMQVERLDLLQFHAWNYADPNWLDCLFWLQELKEQGLIRYLGLTNFDTAHLRIILHSGIEVVSNQVCYSLLDQRPSGGMTELCLEHGIKLLVYGTVAGGLLTEHWLNKPEPESKDLVTWSQQKYRRFINEVGGWGVFQTLLNTVANVAKRQDVSMANVACRYILEQPAVGGIIIGARLGESEHLQDNLRLFQFSLDDASKSEIGAALTNIQPVPGDCGDEYRKTPFLTATGDLSHHVDTIPPPYKVNTDSNGLGRVKSGTTWEEIAGYCRAVRRDEQIWISGTTATHMDRLIGGKDPAAQMHFIIDKIEGVLQSFGCRLEDVIQTRIYIPYIEMWEPIARAHGERFSHILPANTLIQASLVGKEYLVEMEVNAVVNSKPVT
jgi:aryl-alcohol dehydrogenase-like predicted oxidoreductase/enamine deaminase RidA (YjgF/YER057c/UK114 family)